MLPFDAFGPELLNWLEQEITGRKLRLVVLDSYTALRGARRQGVDIVKQEAMELGELDAPGYVIAAILVIHHGSKGSSGLDWTQAAAGSFAMTAATEGQDPPVAL